MSNEKKLAEFNERKAAIEALLQTALEQFNVLGYDVLAEFGHCEKMHDLHLAFQAFNNDFSNSPLDESDFPEEFEA